MKSLKESLLDTEEELMGRAGNIHDIQNILDWILKNYKVKKESIIVCPFPDKDDLYTVDIKGTISCINQNITSLTSEIFKFDKVSGDFNCQNCKKLTSLKGAPREVLNFYCYNCRNLTSLEGAPQRVRLNFSCGKCKKLTSLKGAPKEVGKNFYCSDCDNLKDYSALDKIKIGGKIYK